MNHGPHRPHGPHPRDGGGAWSNSSTLINEDKSYRIRGAIFEVNRAMGAGFLEPVYQDCLAIELGLRGIPYVREPELELTYKGRSLLHRYKPDFVCFDEVIVELKAVRDLAPEHQAQVVNYLNASGMMLGLLVNFGCAPARIERFVL